jgi:hypothetical protein
MLHFCHIAPAVSPPSHRRALDRWPPRPAVPLRGPLVRGKKKERLHRAPLSDRLPSGPLYRLQGANRAVYGLSCAGCAVPSLCAIGRAPALVQNGPAALERNRLVGPSRRTAYFCIGLAWRHYCLHAIRDFPAKCFV